MATTRLSIPLLVLTRQRKAEFLRRALKGWRSADNGINSATNDTSAQNSNAGATAKIRKQLACVDSVGDSSGRAGPVRVLPVMPGEKHECIPTEKATIGAPSEAPQPDDARLLCARGSSRRSFDSGTSPIRIIPVMPGTRRNGHTMSCTCKECYELVVEDAGRSATE